MGTAVQGGKSRRAPVKPGGSDAKRPVRKEQRLGTPRRATSGAQLPAAISSFVGRHDEVTRVVKLLEVTRLLTLTGPAGIGKTRLALEAAHQLAATSTDGARWVDIANVSGPDDLAEAVAGALGVRMTPGRSVTDALITRLHRKYVVLVLDKCEHVAEAAGALAEELLQACPGLRVVATSQHPLGVVGESMWQVPPLSLPGPDSPASLAGESGALRLFVERATAAKGEFDLGAESTLIAAEICRRLDGIPLAIELAAARVDVLSLPEIASRLDDRFRLLDGGARGARSDRSGRQSLEAALDWSYDLLSVPERQLLRCLSVFTGGCTLDVAEELCARGEVRGCDVLDLLAGLVSKSLLIADTQGSGTRYRLLETVRHHAAERLSEEGETTGLRGRHASWCLTVADPGSKALGRDAHYRLIETEYENLRAALDWTISTGRKDVALQLAGTLSTFWLDQGYFSEARKWLAAALEATAGTHSSLRAKVLGDAAVLATLTGDVADAMQAVKESLTEARERGDGTGTAWSLNLLGFLLTFAEGPGAALPLMEESVELARKAGDNANLTSLLAGSGRAHKLAGDPTAARLAFEECLKVAQRSGDANSTSSAYLGLGWAALADGQYESAEEHLRHALAQSRRLGYRFETAVALSYLGEVAGALGRDDEAMADLEEGLELARSMQSPHPLVNCLGSLARRALRDGDPDTAAAYFTEAVSLAQASGLRSDHGRSIAGLGEVALARGETRVAHTRFNEALALAKAHAEARAIARALRGLASVAMAEGNAERTVSLHHEALGLLVDVDDRAGMLESLEEQALVAMAKKEWVTTARLLAATSALRVEHGLPRPYSPRAQARFDAALRGARKGLGVKAFEAAKARGSELSLDAAVAFAGTGRGPRERATHGWASLTGSEREVATMAGQGFTNPEIADRLFVSTRTVQGHLRRTFTKLNITSRRQLRGAADEAEHLGDEGAA